MSKRYGALTTLVVGLALLVLGVMSLHAADMLPGEAQADGLSVETGTSEQANVGGTESDHMSEGREPDAPTATDIGVLAGSAGAQHSRWVEKGTLPDVAARLLKQAQDDEARALVHAGYLDFMGAWWGYLTVSPEGSELTLLKESDGECVVTTFQFQRELWQAREAEVANPKSSETTP